METNILGDLMVGLTTLDAAARPIPGIAERWETSPDGLTWTFHLRKARWSDGTAGDGGRFCFRLAPAAGSQDRRARRRRISGSSRMPSAISAGKLPATALGVAAPDPATVIVTLEHPAPYLPELLTLPAALPLPPIVLKTGLCAPAPMSPTGLIC